MRCCTYLRVSTEEQNNGVALERMLFDAQMAVKAIGGDLPADRIFLDTISGKKTDRPDFTSIWGLIESKGVDAVIFSRIDRLGRDAELLLKLGKLFERTGVGAYVCERNKFLDWQDLDDWRYWAQSSVAAEAESRIISSRLLKAHEFNRYKEQSAFVCPFGYKRNPKTRKYEPDLDAWDIAQKMIEIIEEEKGNLARSAARIELDLNQTWTKTGLRRWLRNPVLRGHTPYGRNKGAKETLYNSHSGLDPDGVYHHEKDYRLLTEERYQQIEELLKDRSFYRGPNVGKQLYPLTGLTRCLCGATCTVMKTERKNHLYLYLRCRAGDERFRHLPKHDRMMIHYGLVEKTVIDHLASCANILINAVLDTDDEVPQSQEVLKRMAHIEYLQNGIEQFGDPSGEQTRTIAKIKTEIAGMTQSKTDTLESIRLRDRLSSMSDQKIWYGLTKENLRSSFVSFVQEIVIDFETRKVLVILNPLLRF